MKTGKYEFVFFDDCWHLKLETLDELENYIQLDEKRWKDVLLDYNESKRKHTHFRKNLTYHIMSVSELQNISFLEAVVKLEDELYGSMRKLIKDGEIVYINSVGGYFFGKEIEYEKTIFSDYPISPTFKEDDILLIKTSSDPLKYQLCIGQIEIPNQNGDLEWDDPMEAKKFATAMLVKTEN